MPNWTPEQTEAIVTTGRDVLVSASAGTGKTAVLVERIVRLVLDAAAPVDVDRLLVVTFTEAAAAEMREKIATALRARAADSPDSERARRQAVLLDRAQISTIHAFCSTLIRSHFHDLGLDPEFSILEEDEGHLLRTESARRVLEAEFDRATPRFLGWLDTLTGANPELQARARLLRIHGFLESLDDRDGWLRETRGAYPLTPEGKGAPQPFDQHTWFAPWRKAYGDALGELAGRLEAVHESAEAAGEKIAKWVDSVAYPTCEALSLLESGDYGRAIGLLRDFEIPRRPPVKKDSVADPDALASTLKEAREYLLDPIQANLAAMTTDEACRAHMASAPYVHLLLDLAERFAETYGGAKRLRAALDFADLEQMCLRLLRDGDGPSEVARLCREQFEHVLVDEYQDINPVQDAILSLVSRSGDSGHGGNLFAVGDVKQSIYAFRLAAPEIFLGKYDSFAPIAESAPGGGAVRIDLTRNFRSRSGVLYGANFVFERLMRRDTAGLDYDEAAALEPGATFPPADESDPLPVEVHVLEGEPKSDADPAPKPPHSRAPEEWSASEREAYLVGRRILDMVRGTPALHVADTSARPGSDGLPPMRPARFGDVVILLRSLRGQADGWLSLLGDLGVPAFADVGTGFFAALEVRDVLNLLRLIDNPLQDIPLASALRSPLEGWSETELAEIRSLAPDVPFHEAFRLAVSSDNAAGKAAEFAERLEAWRTRARRGPLADLVSALYDDTGYPTYVSGLSGGGVRRANLRRLHDMAREFDTFSRQGLGRFLRFVEELRREEGDYGAATPLGESQDVVRIMSIHKSKGLEFPVVFVASLGRGFNLGDSRSDMTLSREGGMALRVTDLASATRYPTPGLLAEQRAICHDALAEEMRLLYVAMTRARERLVLSATAKDLASRVETWDDAAGLVLTGDAMRPLDWLGPIVADHAEGRQGLGIPPKRSDGPPVAGAVGREGRARFAAQVHGADEIRDWPLPSEIRLAPEPEERREPERDPTGVAEAALARIRWENPHVILSREPARLSVSELKRRLAGPAEAGERVVAVVHPEGQFNPATIVADGVPSDGMAAAERGTLTQFWQPRYPRQTSRQPIAAADRRSSRHPIAAADCR